MAAHKENNDVYLWGGTIAIGVYFIAHHEWSNLIAYLPFLFFLLAWFFLLIMPTQCRFPIRKDGSPCRNRSYGIIFGCWHIHWWMKARTKLRIGREETPPSPARSRRRGTGFETYARKDETIPVRVEETRKDRITFRLGVLSFCLGLVTSAGQIVNGVETAAKWVISLL